MSEDVRNVVVVIIDALRHDRVGAYTDGQSLTPNIDRLAEDGTVFTHAFSCTNTTDPSVTSIHTGRDPETVVKHHGPFVSDAEKSRAEAVTTVPERLQAANLNTLVSGRTLGRWHRNGFEHYPEASLGRYRRRAIGEKIGTISPKLRDIAGRLYEGVSSVFESESSDEVDAFVDAIDDRPFYGLIHMMDTHVPYSYDSDVVERLLEQNCYPDEDLDQFFADHSDNPYLDETIREYVEPEDYDVGLARWFAKYDAAVVKADKKIGKLADSLEKQGKKSETTLIIISDHGESLDEHGIFFEHHGLYEQQIRVPMVVAGAAPSQRRDELVQLYDLAPTVLDLLDVAQDSGFDGQSLAPLLTGAGTWDSRDHVVFQEANAQRRLGIRTRTHKYLKSGPDSVLERERGDAFRCGYCDTVHGSERELYHLDADPGERDNIVDRVPELAEDLDEALESYYESLEPIAVSDGDTVGYEQEEDVLERLEDLGYR